MKWTRWHQFLSNSWAYISVFCLYIDGHGHNCLGTTMQLVCCAFLFHLIFIFSFLVDALFSHYLFFKVFFNFIGILVKFCVRYELKNKINKKCQKWGRILLIWTKSDHSYLIIVEIWIFISLNLFLLINVFCLRHVRFAASKWKYFFYIFSIFNDMCGKLIKKKNLCDNDWHIRP